MGVQLGSAYGRVDLDVSGIRSGVQEAQSAMAGMRSSMESAANSLASVGTTLSVGVSLPLLAVGGAALKTAMDYESSMNMFEAVTGATADQMAEASRVAMQLGADMTLPATSAADAVSAMTELGKAGLSVRDSLDAAKGALQLSAAGHLSEAQAAEISANALNTFGLAGSEAARISDLLAAAANASSAEVTDVADSLRMAGSVFAAAHVPIQDVVTAIGEMANQGIKGQDAGTSLKSMLLALEAPSQKAAGLMAQLGLNIYDAEGKMLPFRDIIATFSARLSGMSQQQRNTALATIFGADAVRSANVVLLGGVDAYDKMAAAVTRQGAAADLAGARSKGLRGALDGLKSQFETIGLVIAERVTPILEAIARTFADIVPRILQMNPALLNAGLAFAAVLAAAGPVALALSGVLSVLAALSGPIGLVVLAVAGLAAAWAADFGGIREITAQAVQAVQGGAATLRAAFERGGLPEVARVAGQAIADWFNGWRTYLAASLPQWIAAVRTHLTDWFNGWKSYLTGQVGAWAGQISEALAQLWSGIKSGSLGGDMAKLAVGIEGAVTQLASFLEPTVERIKRAFAGLGSEFAPLGQKLQTLWATLQSAGAALQPVVAALGAAIGAVSAIFVKLGGEALAGWLSNIGGILGGVVDIVTGDINAIAAVIGGLVNIVTSLIQGNWAGAWQAAQTMASQFVSAFGQIMNGLVAILDGLAAVIWNALVNTVNGLLGTSLPTWEQLKTGITTTVTGLATALSTTWETIRTGAAGAWQGIVSTIQTIWGGIVEAVRGPLNAVIQQVNQVIEAYNRIKPAFMAAIPTIAEIPAYQAPPSAAERSQNLAPGGQAQGGSMLGIGPAAFQAAVAAGVAQGLAGPAGGADNRPYQPKGAPGTGVNVTVQVGDGAVRVNGSNPQAVASGQTVADTILEALLGLLDAQPQLAYGAAPNLPGNPK